MVGFDLFALAQEMEIDIWPENARAFDAFTRLKTQWRSGFGGAAGLDYTAALAYIRTLRLSRDEADELFEDIQIMEYAALEAMAEGRDKNN